MSCTPHRARRDLGTLLFGSPDDVTMLAALVPERIGFAAEVMSDTPVGYYRFAEPVGARKC